MAELITLYKVFVASPGNLSEEREILKRTLYRYNEEEAEYEKVLFHPVSWEASTVGIIRPQDRINEDLNKCDYMVLILWDRWGFSPGKTEGSEYTSATEEEFHRALENYEDKNKPMKDILVLFKEIRKDKIKDAGPQLNKVLKFKEILSKEKKVFYKNFSDNDLPGLLRSHLGKWLRNHKEGGEKMDDKRRWEFSQFHNKHIEHIPFPGEKELDEKDDLVRELNEAKRLGEENEIIKAEQKYELLEKKYNHLNVKNDYAKFLFRLGQRSKSERYFKEILEWALMDEDKGWISRANANLAIIFKSRGQLDNALEYLEKSLEYNKKLNHRAGIADNYRHLADIKRIKGDLDSADEKYDEALKIFREINYKPGIADTLADAGILYKIKSDFSKSKIYQEKSLSLNKSLNRISCKSDNYSHLGTIYRLKGELSKAEKFYNKAIEINSSLNRKHGIAEDLGHLGVVCIEKGQIKKARSHLHDALILSESLKNDEGIAKHLYNFGRLCLLEQNYNQAEKYLFKAMEINKLIQAKEGVAAVNYLFGLLNLMTHHYNDAETTINRALNIWQDMDSKLGIADCFELLGLLNKNNGNYELAEISFDKSISLSKEIGAKLAEASARINLAKMYEYCEEKEKSSCQKLIVDGIYEEIGFKIERSK